jgi:hypothetical protein
VNCGPLAGYFGRALPGGLLRLGEVLVQVEFKLSGA